MLRLTTPRLSVFLAAALAGLTACDTSPADPVAHDHLSAHAVHGPSQALEAHGDLFKAVRQASSRFNSTNQALRAGYVPDPHCAAHPVLGGMGHHWVNEDLVDPVFDPLQPEVVLYEPGPRGNLQLVAVEYIVIDVGQEHPHFDGHPFDVGGVPPLMAAGVPHWSLHVWIHKENPSGIFAPWNPNVSCD